MTSASESASAPPFFIVAAERSGTTLLRVMLDGHPELAVPHEFDFAVSQLGPEAERGEWPDLADYYAFLGDDGSFLRSHFEIDEALPYPELVRGWLRQAQGDKAQVGMAVHHSIDRLHALWPEARYIHLVRDPRDVALSVVAMGWEGHPPAGVERWRDAEVAWNRICERVPEERRFELSYETLISESTHALHEICAFLGTGYHEGLLSYRETTTYSEPDPTNREKWRKRLSPRDLELIEARLGGLLAARGYEPVNAHPRPPDTAEQWRLKARNWLERSRFRARRYGWPLLLADVVTRRLPIPGLAAAVRRRRQAIESQFIR